jgi:rhodanese-related sulfurtransferase
MPMSKATLERFAAAHADGATLIDVREPVEYLSGTQDGQPLVHRRTGELDRSLPLYVVCATGNRSSAMADYLAGAGFDARSVAGGTAAWASSGRTVVTDARPHSA